MNILEYLQKLILRGIMLDSKEGFFIVVHDRSELVLTLDSFLSLARRDNARPENYKFNAGCLLGVFVLGKESMGDHTKYILSVDAYSESGVKPLGIERELLRRHFREHVNATSRRPLPKSSRKPLPGPNYNHSSSNKESRGFFGSIADFFGDLFS